VILVPGGVKGGALALAEGVVQGSIHPAGGDAHAGRRIPVDGHIGGNARILAIGTHVFQLRQAFHGLLHPGLPSPQFPQIVRLEGELVLGIARAAADPHILGRLEKQAGARYMAQFFAQAVDDLVGGNLSFLEGLQAHEHHAPVALAAPGVTGHEGHCRVFHDNALKGFHFLTHGLEGNGLIRLNHAHNPPRILLGKKALGNDDVEIDREPHGGQQQGEHQPAVIQGPGQTAAIAILQVVKQEFQSTQETAPAAGRPRGRGGLGLVLTRLTQQISAQGGGGGQGDHQGDQNGDGEGHREFPEEAPHNASHGQDGDKHGNQGKAHGEHGKTHLPGPLKGGLEGGHARLPVPGDVFQYHDGVIHNKAGGDGEGHEGQVIQAVARQIHDPEGADQGNGDSHGGNQGGPAITQEEEDHQDHQGHGNGQGFFHIQEGAADGSGPVHDHLGIDRAGDGGFQIGQQGFDPIHRIDNVGPGLPVNHQGDGGLAIG